MYLRTVIYNNTNYHLLDVCCHPDTILRALYATFTSCNKPLKQVLFFPCNRINIAGCDVLKIAQLEDRTTRILTHVILTPEGWVLTLYATLPSCFTSVVSEA